MSDSQKRPQLAASAAVFRDGKVLIARRGKPPHLWSLPGGRVEIGETLEQAAAREVLEETGITCEIAGFAGHREMMLRDEAGSLTAHFVIAAFAARWTSGEARPDEEASEVAWVDPTTVANFDTTPGLAEIVERARKILPP
jgi:8-oxo-dGTP diphosphatase